MSKYAGLTSFLAEVAEAKVTLSFESINDMIGGELPDSAFRHRPWWANRTQGRGAQNLAWQSVGWETRDVNMELDEVTFVKTNLSSSASPSPSCDQVPLTIAQAKAGLAATFGVPADSIEITVRG